MKKRRWERELREKTPEDVPFYMGMDEYVEDVRTGDFTTDDFMDLTDDEKFYMAQGMFKGETDFGSYELKDYHKYMPTYDQKEEKDLRTEGYKAVRRTGEQAQTGLMGLINKEEAAIGQRGFASTGNPMVDRQRQNIFSRVYDTQWDIQDETTEGVTGLREDYHTDWEDALYDWIDATNVGE